MKYQRNRTPVSQLAQVLRVDVDAGHLFWVKTRGPAIAGQRAGFQKKGRCWVTVFGKDFSVSRVVWALAHGEWPVADIDHIDRDPTNNALTNLRETSHTGNMQNRNKHRNNTSGHPGVSASGSKWYAKIHAGNRCHYLGTFATKDLAAAAYRAAKTDLHI